MTEWWSTSAPRRSGDAVRPEPAIDRDPDPVPVMPAFPPEPPVRPEEPEPRKLDRRKSLILGATGAAVAGVLVFAIMPYGGNAPTGNPDGSASVSDGEFLPSAGREVAGDTQDRSSAPSAPVRRAPKTVTITALPEGSGSVGAIVKVTVVNRTDETIVVMSSMVKGDGRSAVVGEGTLAPGSRRIGPGETVTGTVEFASKRAPGQVALVDLCGNVVASSD